MAVDEARVARKFEAIAPFLDERQRRLWMGVEAREAGHGGISAVARATGVSRPTVVKAVKELGENGGGLAPGRVRRRGGGRKKATELDPGLVEALEGLVGSSTRGDPESPLLWTSKSTRDLADALAAEGHQASHV